jgi:REP element-mobilizing transposase RayT
VLDSWRFLQANGRLTLYGYVVMENHLHFIASAPDLAAEVKNFKSYTARRIIDFLEQRADARLLDRLGWLKLRHKTESRYQLWQEGSHPKQITGEEMMVQKLEYTHNNPVRRGYVDRPEDWRYSSARNYLGLPGLIEVTTDWR